MSADWERRNPDRQMDAYYYSFDRTGVPEIDAILAAVAWAGKAYHHTDSWTDAKPGERSVAEQIQDEANKAAEAFRRLRP